MLVYAHREDAPDHRRYRTWLEDTLASEPAFGVSDLILSAFVRIASHPGIFGVPTPIEEAVGAAERLRQRPNGVRIAPGPHHWDIFARLCRVAGVKGALVTDAYFAALAIESGSEWITTDRDFARFPGLRWRHPLAAK